MNIKVKPIPVSEEVLEKLESYGVIRRIRPGKDILETEKGQSKHASVYECDDKFGPHKLICVTINSSEPSNFLYHNDHEDFMLIDLPNKTDLIITMSIHHHTVLEEKIENKTLSPDDFMSVIFKPNDPYLSFFTMKAGYPHVETCSSVSDTPPSFYVGECRDLDENHIDFKTYKLEIEV
ncbi:hypothetical protein EZV73_10775 [Acidaminobacter sp. JC074]|uniref:hypothetical protein n=1 Tax=Acidaminobacter sp. JC074 TaxID=2530199 RepID=UPI001F10C4E0|nr:hypothetical protein [Acidaminobacter sp. JC074]MCH4888061.1 hypothetical protein [Acidaminobacter sp. JC074]